jgi:hypothetical protein
MKEIIDLLDDTPPSSPRRPLRVDADGVILLLSDSEDEEQEQPRSTTVRTKGKTAAAATTESPKKRSSSMQYFDRSLAPKEQNPNKRLKAPPPASSSFPSKGSNFDVDSAGHEDDNLDRKPAATANNAGNKKERDGIQKEPSDGEVAIVSYVEKEFRPATDTGGDDDDLQILGSTGVNALADYPHSRENCVTFPMTAMSMNQTSNIKHCDNCFCFCCDIPAKDCQQWNQHCQARHKNRHWQRVRKECKKRFMTVVTTTPTSNATSGAARAGTASASQSPSAHQQSRRVYSTQDLLDRVTVVYPSEINPPAIVRTILKHYQKQSLAFMKDVESLEDVEVRGFQRSDRFGPGGVEYNSVGGWLASEVGMGKSLVVISLVASDGQKPLPLLRCNQDNTTLLPMKRLKATIVVTSVSLMGQWEDEVRKHAPDLVCYRLHTSDSKYGMNLKVNSKSPESFNSSMMEKADIIITSGTFKFNRFIQNKNYIFNRVVVDEAHLLGTISMHYKGDIKSICAQRRWCVTATPCTSGIRDLDKQINLLGMQSQTIMKLLRFSTSDQGFADAVDLLKKMMSRLLERNGASRRL